MTAAETPLLDLPDFLRSLRAERHTAMLIHGAPLFGKSRFARQFAEKMDAGYLDVLEALSLRLDLSAAIDQFDVAALRRLILEFTESISKDVILIDNLDFLFPVWGGDLKPFQDMLYNLYHPRRATIFVFFAQTRPEWNAWQLETANQRSRIVEIGSIKAP